MHYQKSALLTYSNSAAISSEGFLGVRRLTAASTVSIFSHKVIRKSIIRFVQLRAALTSAKPGSSGYGIYYRATDSAAISGYCFQYDPGAGNRFVVKKVTNGTESSSFQTVSMSKVMGSRFDIAASHNIEISVAGDNHIITVDGIKVMDFNGSTFISGSVGVRSWNDSKVQISNINVTAN